MHKKLLAEHVSVCMRFYELANISYNLAQGFVPTVPPLLHLSCRQCLKSWQITREQSASEQ